MSDKLCEYLLDLNERPELLAKHNADPLGAARDYGLDEADIALIDDENYDEIKSRFNQKAAAAQLVATFHTP
jgi:hypothetical protein